MASIGEWIQSALKQAGISQAELARRLTSLLGRSIDRAAVNKIIHNKRTITADEWVSIARLTKMESEFNEFARGNIAVQRLSKYQESPHLHFFPKADDLKAQKIPMYGRAIVGADGVAMDGRVIGWTFCPPGFEDVDRIYASYINGNTMFPRYKTGEVVWMHPNKPPKGGDDVFLQIQREGEEPPLGIAREFIAWDGDTLSVSQHNPPQNTTFQKNEVLAMHVIVFCSRG